MLSLLVLKPLSPDGHAEWTAVQSCRMCAVHVHDNAVSTQRLFCLQELAAQMQAVCKGAGAPVLELTLLQEEPEQPQPMAQQQQQQIESASIRVAKAKEALEKLQQRAAQYEEQLMTERSLQKQRRLEVFMRDNSVAQRRIQQKLNILQAEQHKQEQDKQEDAAREGASHYASVCLKQLQQEAQRVEASLRIVSNPCMRGKLEIRKRQLAEAQEQAAEQLHKAQEAVAKQAQLAREQDLARGHQMQENRPPNKAPRFQPAVEAACKRVCSASSHWH